MGSRASFTGQAGSQEDHAGRPLRFDVLYKVRESPPQTFLPPPGTPFPAGPSSVSPVPLGDAYLALV